MGNTLTSGRITSIPVSNSIVPSELSSFVYQDLVLHVKTLQHEMAEVAKFLEARWTNEKKIRNEFKSRSLKFVDPYGNVIVDQYMDHELIRTLVRKYKKDYVPRYLHQWIKIGTMNKGTISPMSESELQSTVSDYPDGHQFITYGELPIWIIYNKCIPPQQLMLYVLVTDSMEKIKMEIQESRKLTNIELKSFIINGNTRPNQENWDEGRILKSDDTILSGKLYQQNCIIMAKLSQKEVRSSYFHIHLV